MTTQKTVTSGFIIVAIVVGLSFAKDSQKDDAYSCKAMKHTSIECSRSNKDCVSKTGSDGEEILLTNPQSVSPRIMRQGIGAAYNLKRLSVTKDFKSFYLATTGDMGGMAFYLWLPDSKSLFEIKAHNISGDFSSTILYSCRSK